MIRGMNRIVFFITAFLGSMAWAQSNSSNPGNISRMYGEIAITNNYIDKGITQSDKGASIYAGAGYWFGGNGRIAFQANSVKFPSEDANVETRFLAEFKFNFTQLTNLRLRNDFVRYFPVASRDSIEMSLDLDVGGMHFIVLRDDNFENTKLARTWYAFSKNWPLNVNWSADTAVGYSIIPGYSSFFDTRLAANYLKGNMTYSLGGTWVSSASQFNGQADLMAFLNIAAKF
jgi:hypothetical protein